MDIAALKSELNGDPLARGYAKFIADCPGTIVDMLNALVYSMPKTTLVTARSVLSSYGSSGATILDKLEAAATQVSAVKWAMKFMLTDGVDASSMTTHGLLDAIAAGGVAGITQAEVDKLKTLGIQPASRAEVLGLGIVTEADVRAAMGS